MMEVKWAGRRRGALIPQSVGMRLGRVRLCVCTLGAFTYNLVYTQTWNSMTIFSCLHVSELGFSKTSEVVVVIVHFRTRCYDGCC